ncbi:serine hydrolase [Deinococcus ruber]|uniref:Serine hydrolase n=1 Tax=Deinococcus ruber TaxID=1848197 RepID=A0A918CB12_9DEIO|nr:serine hydrolase [Deinococcus ruber]GGR14024.1 serine hydrolase [Deinococcus ruber]
MFGTLLPALLTAQLAAGSMTANASISLTPAPCGPAPSIAATSLPLPAAVSGRVRFYAARYDPQTLAPLGAVALGRVNEVQPLASTFKPLVVHGMLEDVDAGRFTLSSVFTTTPANRSIERFPAGKNSLLTLAKRAIVLSDNTAADLLMLAYGPQRLARSVQAQSPCTSVLLTTKAWWTAQAGLAAGVLGTDTLAGAQHYAQQGFEDRVQTARQLIAASANVEAPALERALDSYFHGPAYTQALELALQNTSTVNAYADLMARTLPGNDLRPATRRVFRDIMEGGCCRPKQPALKTTYWAAKAGSGWRILNLVGYVETADGTRLAYAYFNDQSNTTDSEQMELQIPSVVKWIQANLLTLASP